MVKAKRVLVGVLCVLLVAVVVGCAPKRGWNRPLFSAGNCGLSSPLSSDVFKAPAREVSSALRTGLQGRGWEPLQDDVDQLETLYKRTVTEPAATEGLPGPHYQYLLVIVTPIKDQASRVSLVLSELDPESDLGTSFALVAPEDFIDGYDDLVQSVRESVQATGAREGRQE